MSEVTDVELADTIVAGLRRITYPQLKSLIACHRETAEAAAYQRGKIEGARLGLEAAAEWFAERFSEAVQVDTENGVKCLNERAAAAYLKDAPDTLAAIREGDAAIRALDIPSILKDEA